MYFREEDTEIRFRILHHFSQRSLVSRYAVSFCWLAGLLLGFCATKSVDQVFYFRIFDCVSGTVSLIRLLLIHIIPFAVLFVAVLTAEYWLIPFVCILEAFAFSFCGCSIGYTFGQGAWLVRLLLMFFRSMTLPCLLFLSFSILNCKKALFFKRFVLIFIYTISITIIDYIYIVPLLRIVLS